MFNNRASPFISSWLSKDYQFLRDQSSLIQYGMQLHSFSCSSPLQLLILKSYQLTLYHLFYPMILSLDLFSISNYKFSNRQYTAEYLYPRTSLLSPSLLFHPLLSHLLFPTPTAAMVRQIFKGRVLAAAGPLPGQLTVENLKRWTALRKGHFSEDLDDTVTHLLCTRDQFKKKVPRGMHIGMKISACLRCIRP